VIPLNQARELFTICFNCPNEGVAKFAGQLAGGVDEFNFIDAVPIHLNFTKFLVHNFNITANIVVPFTVEVELHSVFHLDHHGVASGGLNSFDFTKLAGELMNKTPGHFCFGRLPVKPIGDVVMPPKPTPVLPFLQLFAVVTTEMFDIFIPFLRGVKHITPIDFFFSPSDRPFVNEVIRVNLAVEEAIVLCQRGNCDQKAEYLKVKRHFHTQFRFCVC
jgi:hypothetical protein